MISDEQWEAVEEKYGKLLHSISNRISGDNAIANHEDNYQDLQIAVLHAIQKFEEQNGGMNGTFEEFWGTKGFDKYLKTVLWNFKNNKGAKITKYWPVTRNTVSTYGNEEVLNLEASEDTSEEIHNFILGLSNSLDDDCRKALTIIVNTPDILHEKSSTINVSYLARLMGTYQAKAQKIVDKISKITENTL